MLLGHAWLSLWEGAKCVRVLLGWICHERIRATWHGCERVLSSTTLCSTHHLLLHHHVGLVLLLLRHHGHHLLLLLHHHHLRLLLLVAHRVGYETPSWLLLLHGCTGQ